MFFWYREKAKVCPIPPPGEGAFSLTNALAEAYLEFGTLNKTPEKIPAAGKTIARIIGEVKDADALRRWCWLASFLNSFYYESVRAGGEKSGGKINLDMI